MSVLISECKKNCDLAQIKNEYPHEMELRARITEARQDAKLNKSQLARACNVDPSAINHLETGNTKTLSGELLLKMSDVLGVEAMWLQNGRLPKHRTDTPQTTPAAPVTPTLTTDQLIEMLASRLAAEAPEQAQDAIAVLQGEVSKARRRGVEPPQFSNQREAEPSVTPKKATSG